MLFPGPQGTPQFITDVYCKWKRHGSSVIDRVIATDPAAFLRTVAQILPKELDQTFNMNINLIEARDFNANQLKAMRHIGADPTELIEGQRQRT